ncbi:MAG: aspartate dehydrogenase domain-containing protein [Candidatus Micrarchaeia archaeon]
MTTSVEEKKSIVHEKPVDFLNKKVGIIGYGKIGSYVANRGYDEKKFDVKFIYDIDIRKVAEAKKKFPVCLKEEIIEKSKECDLVVESASFEAVKEFYKILHYTNMLICSTSALFYFESLERRIRNISKEFNTKLFIPHGALIGLDGIELFDEITIITTKSPESLIKYPEKKSLKELGKRGVIYIGDVIGACKNFPLNVNSHAAIALIAGVEKVKSRIEAYEGGNMHQIIAKRKNERMIIEIESRFSSKTSEYVPESIYFSILEVLKDCEIKKC